MARMHIVTCRRCMSTRIDDIDSHNQVIQVKFDVRIDLTTVHCPCFLYIFRFLS